MVRECRQRAHMTQADLAARAATSQPAIAKLEQGDANPTLETLERCASAMGYALRIELVPRQSADPVVERYKEDVDRTLLRENLRRPLDERIRTLGEWQENAISLQQAARTARRRK